MEKHKTRQADNIRIDHSAYQPTMKSRTTTDLIITLSHTVKNTENIKFILNYCLKMAQSWAETSQRSTSS